MAEQKKRVIFTFDQRSLQSLEEIRDQAKMGSLADAVKDSLQVRRALQQQADRGFTEIVVRNPETKAERVMVIPSLQTS
jgi:hypothetical protein